MILRLHSFIIQIAKFNNIWNTKFTNIKYKFARTIKDIFIVHNILFKLLFIQANSKYIKTTKYTKIYIKFLIFNTKKDNSEKKESKESQNLNQYII